MRIRDGSSDVGTSRAALIRAKTRYSYRVVRKVSQIQIKYDPYLAGAFMSRVGTIVEQIAGLVARGVLKPEQRLPSVRAGAVEHGVSKNTMADAYDRLVAMGHLQARPGSGYYVAATRPLSSAQRSRHVAQAIDTVSPIGRAHV